MAHDFETGAYRFGLAQSVSWQRQLVAKVLVIGAIVLIGSCLLGLLTMWCMAPSHRIGVGYDTGISFWEPDYFNITAGTMPAWALLDFCLGALAGAAIRRTVPAMATVLVAAVSAAILGSGFAVTQYTALPRSCSASRPSPPARRRCCLRSACSRGYRSPASPSGPAAQGASRYWLLQAAAAVILITLAAAAGLLAVRLTSRRS